MLKQTSETQLSTSRTHVKFDLGDKGEEDDEEEEEEVVTGDTGIEHTSVV